MEIKAAFPGKSTTKPKPLKIKIIIAANIIVTANALKEVFLLG
jgi:hypothetical protein